MIGFSLRRIAKAVVFALLSLGNSRAQEPTFNDLRELPAGSSYTYPLISSNYTAMSCLNIYQQLPQTSASVVYQPAITGDIVLCQQTPYGIYCPIEPNSIAIDPKFGGFAGCRFPDDYNGIVIANPGQTDVVLSTTAEQDAQISKATRQASRSSVRHRGRQTTAHEASQASKQAPRSSIKHGGGQIVIVTQPDVVALAPKESYQLQANLTEGNVTCVAQTIAPDNSSSPVTSLVFNSNVQESFLPPLRQAVTTTTSGTDYIDITPANAPVFDPSQATTIMATNKGQATAFLSCFQLIQDYAKRALSPSV